MNYLSPITLGDFRTLSRWWLLHSERISIFFRKVSQFSIFRHNWQVRTCNDFQFLECHITWQLSIRKSLDQPYQCHSLLNMIWPLYEVVWMVSNMFYIFDFSSYFTGSFRLQESKWVIHHQSTQWMSAPYQDGGYNSRMEYRWFLKVLSIFHFLSYLTGRDLQKFSVFGMSHNMTAMHQKRSKSTIPMS